MQNGHQSNPNRQAHSSFHNDGVVTICRVSARVVLAHGLAEVGVAMSYDRKTCSYCGEKKLIQLGKHCTEGHFLCSDCAPKTSTHCPTGNCRGTVPYGR